MGGVRETFWKPKIFSSRNENRSGNVFLTGRSEKLSVAAILNHEDNKT